jgi:hypothetical protein
MYKIVVIVSFFSMLIGCDQSGDLPCVKNAINNNYVGHYGLKKVGEIEKLDEDFFDLAVHYSKLEEYCSPKEDVDYRMVRHIYKTDKGVYRMFYIVNCSDEQVVKKSSDYSRFFEPICYSLFGKENQIDYAGDNLMDFYRH